MYAPTDIVNIWKGHSHGNRANSQYSKSESFQQRSEKTKTTFADSQYSLAIQFYVDMIRWPQTQRLKHYFSDHHYPIKWLVNWSIQDEKSQCGELWLGKLTPLSKRIRGKMICDSYKQRRKEYANWSMETVSQKNILIYCMLDWTSRTQRGNKKQKGQK